MCIRDSHFFVSSVLKRFVTSMPVYVYFGSHADTIISIVNGEATGEETIVTITSYICSFIITVSLLFLLQKKAQKMLREELRAFETTPAAAESRRDINNV